MPRKKPKYDKEYLRAVLITKAEEAVDEITHSFFRRCFAKLPVEEWGHGHHTFSRGLAKTGLPKSKGLASKTISGPKVQKPDDKQAIRRGLGRCYRRKTGIKVKVKAKLPYLRVLEYGGTIRAGVKGKKGPKKDPDSLGRLYAARGSGNSGVLHFKRNGSWVFTPTRTVSGIRFFASAAEAAAERATKLGLKAR